MRDVLGILSACSIWAIYIGIGCQWRKVWRNNVTPSIPRTLFVISGLSYCCYTLWGLASRPIDPFMVAAFAPGLFIVPVSYLQFSCPRPELRWIGTRTAEVCMLLAAAAIAWVHLEPSLQSRVQLVALAASCCSVGILAIAIPLQVRQLIKEGSRGSSLAFNVINLAGYGLWFSYGIVKPDLFLVYTQGLGCVLQTAVVLLHFRR